MNAQQVNSPDTPDEFAPGEPLFEEGRDPALSDDAEDNVGARLDEGSEGDGAQDASATEIEAMDAGWVPKNEWKGDPDKWKPADVFLDFRSHVLPVVQRENRSLRQEVETLKRERDQERLERAQAQQRIERETLRLELKAAREEGDWDKVDAITEKMFDLRTKQVQAPAPAAQAIDPQLKRVHDEFVDANPWLKDITLKRNFYRELSVIANTNTADSPEEAMRDAKDRVRRMFPERFRSTPTSSMAESSTSHGSPRSGNGHTWNDLKPSFRSDFEDTQRRLKLSGKELEASRKRILANCTEEPDKYFRR